MWRRNANLPNQNHFGGVLFPVCPSPHWQNNKSVVNVALTSVYKPFKKMYFKTNSCISVHIFKQTTTSGKSTSFTSLCRVCVTHETCRISPQCYADCCNIKLLQAPEKSAAEVVSVWIYEPTSRTAGARENEWETLRFGRLAGSEVNTVYSLINFVSTEKKRQKSAET